MMTWQVSYHRTMMLNDMIHALSHRLKRIATGKEAARLEAAASPEHASHHLRVPGLANDLVAAAQAAAQAAMDDPALKLRKQRAN